MKKTSFSKTIRDGFGLFVSNIKGNTKEDMYIAIIDYGMGNIKSVENSFINSGAAVKVTSDPAVIDGSSAVILPGTLKNEGSCIQSAGQ